MASNDVVRARIDKKIKDEAGNVLSEMGLSIDFGCDSHAANTHRDR